MKPIHLHSWIGGAAVMLMLSLAASCTDDELLRHDTPTDGMAFAPSIDNRGWTAGNSTRTRNLAGTGSRHCVEELRDENGRQRLYLHTTETDSIAAPDVPDTARIATRGAIVTTEGFTKAYGSFGVLAYAYHGEWDGTQTPNYIYNEKVTASGGTYGFSPSRFWPGKEYNMAFFAYAPYGEENITLSGQSDEGAPTLTYTVPEKITEQKDLLAYWKTDVPGAKSATAYNLEFNHLCTAVKFKVGKNLESAIRTISIKNVYGSGTYSAASEKWGVTGEADQTYTFNANRGIVHPEDTELTTGENIFMMIPQTLVEEAALEVTFNDGTTLTGSIAGQTWQKGYTVVYKISASEILYDYTLEGPTEGFTFNHLGGKQEAFSIKSYKTRADNKDEKQIPVAWTADFVEEKSDGTYEKIDCDWVTGFNNSSDNTANSVRSFSVNAQVETNLGNIEDKELQKAASVTDKDLSMVNGTMNTANCYIVNGPGTYKFPLVYGNAIKNSQTNKNAYTCESVPGLGYYDKFLKIFVNHLDLAITSPFIEENENAENTKLEAKGAKVVWYQGMENMITVDDNNALTSEKITVDGKEQQIKYLHFTVAGGQNIKQGNAIIAVTDAKGTTMWSWHIWVTPYLLEKDNITLTDAARNTTTVMMPHNIGYVTNDKIKYEGREVYLRITQSEKAKDEEAQVLYIPIKQEEYERQNLGSNTLYQHGRKDPMPGPTKKYTEGKNEISGIETKYFGNYEESTDGLTLGEAIQNPGKCIVRSDWITQDRYTVPSLNQPTTEIYLRQILNLWRSGKDGNSKSVYDPSPAGFIVPTLEDVKYFYWPAAGTIAYTLSDLNTPWDKTEVENQMSLAFYTHKAASKDDKPEGENLIYFPLTGSTDNKENVATVYWVRERANKGTHSLNGEHYIMQKEDIHFTSDGSSIGKTHAIRPIQEND